MPYMVMLILGEPNDLDDVLDAWKALDVWNVTFVDSMCSLEGVCRPRPRIPIRFAFENLGAATERCSCTLFAIAGSEETAHACIAKVEAIVGDLDAVPGSAVVAWPLSIVKGVSGLGQHGALL
jgi:hypothetical protein